MKLLQILLVCAIFGYCIMDDAFDCKTPFETLLKAKCEAIGSCTYDSVDGDCVETHDCSTGNVSVCGSIHPTSFHTNKCELSGTRCEMKEKLCGDFDTNGITGDDCTQLVAPNKNDQRCIPYNLPCKAHYNDCTKITTNDNNECTNNVPSNPLGKCTWDYDTSKCNSVITRNCGDYPHYYDNIETCPSLLIQGTDRDKKKCIYDNNNQACAAKYEKCEDTPLLYGNLCQQAMPLNANNDDYDYTQYCIKSGTNCIHVKRKCKEFDKSDVAIPTDLLSEELCGQLEVTEDYLRCAYNETSNKCYEEYKTCEDYINNKVETDRKGCENIVLTDKNTKCVYITEKDECQTRNIYSKCGDYKGNDKKICESIVLYPNNRSYCILDKDKECIEKSINCSEAETEEDCLNIAKASESNKRCAYNPNNNNKPKCYEEYIRCEDYVQDPQSSNYCSYIKLYDGKTCKSESVSSVSGYTSICRSNYKNCGDTKNKEECKLIAITGVSDPERKVCDYVESSSSKICFENYKYCSDYRGTNKSACTYIKPYDESGDNVDIRYKCELEDGVGCQRVPVECEDAKKNPILCEEFSQYIKDKDKKYCLFYGGSCITQYQKCEYVDQGSSYNTKCTSNIIKGRIRNVCKQNSTTFKCYTENQCSLFSPPSPYTSPTSKSKYYKELCESINPNCTFDTNGDCVFKEKACDDILFYTDDENNKQICENMKVSKPYKKCVLRANKTGCETVYIELDYATTYNSYISNTSNSNQESSSNIISKSVSLVITLLCLLI